MLPDVFGFRADDLELLAHVLLGAVLVVAAASMLGRGHGWRRPVRNAFLGSLVFLNGIEVAQVTARSRNASLVDLGANTLGVVVGSLVALGLAGLPERYAARALSLVLVAAIAAGSWAVLVPVPLGHSCPTTMERSPAPLAPARLLPDSTIVSYRLADAVVESTLRVPARGGGSELVAEGPGPVVPVPSGVRFGGEGGDVRLVSTDAGSRFAEAVAGTDSMLVEVTVVPAASPSGPVPIVALSGGRSPSDMNIHVGQHGDELSVRLRLGCGHFNWTRIDDVFEKGVRRHIVVSYEGRVQRVWVDGDLVDERRFGGELAGGVNWDPTLPLVVGNEPTGGRQFVGDIEEIRLGLTPGGTSN